MQQKPKTLNINKDWLETIETIIVPPETTHSFLIEAVRREIKRRCPGAELSRRIGSGGARAGAGRRKNANQ